MRKLHVVLILFLLGLPAWAGVVVISVDTPGGIVTGGTVDSNDALAVAWSQPTTTLSSVDIYINFQNLFGSGNTYSAYLTDAIGVGTDPSFDQIAFNQFSGPDQPGWVQVFSNLTLGPSLAYYLIIGTSDGDSTGGWSFSDGPAVVTTMPGITRGDVSGVQFWASSGCDPYDQTLSGCLNAAYLPASSFSPVDADSAAQSGDLLFDVEVPEPSTLWLLAAGVPWLVWLRRRATTA